jgi:hypothetical protein
MTSKPLVQTRLHEVAENGFFAELLAGFQPVEPFHQHEPVAIRRTMIGVCWPSFKMLSAISRALATSSVARRFAGT